METPMQQNTLVKIIVNKSHFKDKLTEVESHGHTLFTGENGDGKSTTLSLYGAFYGAEPSRLVDREAGKLPFAQFYLPDDKSFIAYEYLKQGQPKIAFIYKNGSSGIAYRFADISADALLSQDNINALDNDFKSTRDWLSQHIRQQVDVSQPITTTQDYRWVIQNNRSELGKRRHSNGQLLTVAQRYSLCNPEHSMQHIDVLVSTMMRNNNLLDSFRRMVTDAFIAPKVSLSQSPYNKADINHLDALKAIRELEKHKKTFDNALMLSQRMDTLYREAALLLNQMEAKRDSEIIRKEAIMEELATAQKNLQEFKQKAEDRRTKLNETYSDIKSKLESIDRDLTAINRQRDRYERTVNIQEVLSERDQAEIIRTQHQQAQEHLKVLRKGFESEEKQLEADLQNLDHQHLKMTVEVSQKVAVHNQVLQYHKDNVQEAVKKAQTVHDKNIEQINKTYRDMESKAVTELSDAKVAVERAGNLTPDEHKELDGYQLQINDLRDEIEQENRNLNTANEQFTSLSRSHQELLLDIEAARTTKITHQNKINKIQEILNPASNTLAAFLNKEVPDWKSTWGKTINPTLLSNTKLAPAWGNDAEQHQHLIHGVVLDLSSVNSDFAREEEQLLDDLRTLEAKIISTEKTEQELTRRAQEIYREIHNYKTMMLIARDVIEKHGENVKRIDLQLRNKKQCFAEDLKERVLVSQKHANSCELKVRHIAAEHNKTISDVTNTHNNAILQIKSDGTMKEAEIKAVIEGLEESVKRDKYVTEERKNQLKSAHANKLKSDGIDPVVIALAREAVEKLAGRIDRIEKSHDLIAEYNTWLAKDWSRVDNLNSEEKTFKDRKNAAEALIAKHTKEKDDGIKLHNDKIIRLNQNSNRAHENATELDKAATRLKDTILPEFLIVDGPQKSLDVDIAIDQSRALVKQLNNNRDAIIKSIDKVTDVLNELGTANDISQFWDEVKRQRKQEIEINSPDQMVFGADFKVALLPSLDQLINVVIPEKQSIILEAIRSVSMKYSNFYLTLDDMNKKIRNVSNLLGRSVETSNPFPAIEEVQLGIVSKIEKFESFDSLKAFNLEWEKWEDASSTTIPSTAFIRSFESTYYSLSLLKLNTNLSSLVDLEINMTENGTRRIIRSDADLAGVSSEGISKLACIVVFCGMVRFLCPDENTVIHWPVDELGKISLSNTRLLFNMMTEKGITLVTAEPNYRREMLKYYQNKLHLDRRYGAMTYVDIRKSQSASRLFSVVNTQQEKEA